MFILEPHHVLDEQAFKDHEAELKQTGAKVETKDHTIQGKKASYFRVEASSPTQAAAVHETAQRLGYRLN